MNDPLLTWMLAAGLFLCGFQLARTIYRTGSENRWLAVMFFVGVAIQLAIPLAARRGPTLYGLSWVSVSLVVGSVLIGAMARVAKHVRRAKDTSD